MLRVLCNSKHHLKMTPQSTFAPQYEHNTAAVSLEAGGKNLNGNQPSVEADAGWIRAQRAQVVISGAVSLACAAAAAAGVCCVCIAHSTGGKA